MIKAGIATLGLLLAGTSLLQAQMKRERVIQERPVEDTFLAGSITGMSTVENLPKNNMTSVVMHNFGLVSGGIDSFYGLDEGAAVRLGIDYGITDTFSMGIGRTSEENTVDFRFKYNLLRQLSSDRIPVSVALKGDLGINTSEEPRFDFTFTERLNYLGSVMVARKFSDQFSLQLAPMVSHFNTVIQEDANKDLKNTLYAVGIGGRLKVSKRNAFIFEYIPVVGDRNSGTRNHASLGFEIDTGGHVFQMFFMSGQWFTEQHLIARTNTDISALDFRFGFNINRVFSL
ncbi:MAG: hypothetical protein FH748_01505 [Balneolaceae bacterium]|nr:hypothetical protein [Balneolaceae bacterium]